MNGRVLPSGSEKERVSGDVPILGVCTDFPRGDVKQGHVIVERFADSVVGCEHLIGEIVRPTKDVISYASLRFVTNYVSPNSCPHPFIHPPHVAIDKKKNGGIVFSTGYVHTYSHRQKSPTRCLAPAKDREHPLLDRCRNSIKMIFGIRLANTLCRP